MGIDFFSIMDSDLCLVVNNTGDNANGIKAIISQCFSHFTFSPGNNFTCPPSVLTRYINMPQHHKIHSFIIDSGAQDLASVAN